MLRRCLHPQRSAQYWNCPQGEMFTHLVNIYRARWTRRGLDVGNRRLTKLHRSPSSQPGAGKRNRLSQCRPSRVCDGVSWEHRRGGTSSPSGIVRASQRETSGLGLRMCSFPSREGRSPDHLVERQENENPRFHSLSFIHFIPSDCQISKRKIVNNLQWPAKKKHWLNHCPANDRKLGGIF